MRFATSLSLSFSLLSWVAVVRSQNCMLEVPQNPLTAQGLATPYKVTGCNQVDFSDQGSFVEAVILDPATGGLTIYSPLVINDGMVPVDQSQNTTGANVTGYFIPPIVPTLPDNAVVGIWFGSNAATLALSGDTKECVNGLGNSLFGQFAYCNAEAWFNAAKTAVSQGLIKLPAPGVGSNVPQACPTTHDFRIVDMDQSDNLLTTYLLIANNTLAQNTPDNSNANPDAEVQSNASDNALVNEFIDPALGCSPFQNPCLTCPSGIGSSLATDELQAFFYPPTGGPALISLNDDFVLVNEQPSLPKVNLYRTGTGQPQADSQNASAFTYCEQITQGGIFINENQGLFTNNPSPAPTMATNLFTFLAMRYSATLGDFPGLGCTGLLNITNPVTLTTDGNGIVADATINTQVLEEILAKVQGNSTGASSTSAGTSTTAATSTSASQTTSASTTGVLLEKTSTTSVISTSSIPNSSAPTVTGSIPTTSFVPTSPIPTSLPTVTPSLCSTTATVTVTVTASVAPSQTIASATASASATGKGGWNGHWHGGGNGSHSGNGGWSGWKRSLPNARVHRRSRITSQ